MPLLTHFYLFLSLSPTVCTSVVPDTTSHPPFAFFGDTQSVYVNIYSSNPTPNITTTITLSATVNSTPNNFNLTPASIRDRTLQPPLKSVQYTINIPSIRELQLGGPLEGPADFFLSTSFSGVCSGIPGTIARFAVYESQDGKLRVACRTRWTFDNYSKFSPLLRYLWGLVRSKLKISLICSSSCFGNTYSQIWIGWGSRGWEVKVYTCLSLPSTYSNPP